MPVERVFQASDKIEYAVERLREALRREDCAFGALFVAGLDGHARMLFARDLTPSLRLQMLRDMRTAVNDTLAFYESAQ